MTVVDASVVIEMLLNTPVGAALAGRLLHGSENLAAPQLLDVEVLQVLRRYQAGGDLDAGRGQQAVEDLENLPAARYAHAPLLRRIWELRHNVTAYDAAYLALAEALGARVVTRDERLAAAPGHRADVELV